MTCDSLMEVAVVERNRAVAAVVFTNVEFNFEIGARRYIKKWTRLKRRLMLDEMGRTDCLLP